MNRTPVNCPRCGAPVVAGDRLCFSCGQVLGESPAAGSARPGAGVEPTPPASPPLTPRRSAPQPPVDIDSAGTEPPPWEDRGRYGFWLALWVTWRDSVLKPVEFFRRLPPRSGLGPAIGYVMLISAVALAFNLYWDTVRTLVSGAEEGVLVTVLGSLLLLLLGGAFVLAIYLGLLFVMVGILHLGLMMVGAGGRGYEATFRATAYSAGPAAFAIFPFFGPLIGLIWGTVVLYIAVREVQRTTNGRTVVAFLIPLAALFLFFMILGIIAALIIATAGGL